MDNKTIFVQYTVLGQISPRFFKNKTRTNFFLASIVKVELRWYSFVEITLVKLVIENAKYDAHFLADHINQTPVVSHLDSRRSSCHYDLRIFKFKLVNFSTHFSSARTLESTCILIVNVNPKLFKSLVPPDRSMCRVMPSIE